MKVLVLRKKKLCICFILVLILLIISSAVIKGNELLNSKVKSSYNVEFNRKISELYNGEEKIAYLTFDDGPTKNITPIILDILKSQDIKATFFVIGKKAENNPEIIKRAYEEGHYIANHTYSHNNNTLYRDKQSFIDEIKKTDNIIGEAIGVKDYCSHIIRFPNGYMSPMHKTQKREMASMLTQIGYTYIDWNCLNNDSMKKYTKQQLIENLKVSSKNKNTLVILMHDTKDVSDSSSALKESIEYLKTMGYRFGNFYDLVGK